MNTLNKEQKTEFQLRLWKGPFPVLWIPKLNSILLSMYMESGMTTQMSVGGYSTHTMEQIIAACNGQGEFWICSEGSELFGFLLGNVCKDVNNEPTYVIRQAWVSPSIRRTPIVKQMLSSILLNAKSNFCKHVLLVSSRNEKAYLRWLGHGWKRFTTVLKGEL